MKLAKARPEASNGVSAILAEEMKSSSSVYTIDVIQDERAFAMLNDEWNAAVRSSSATIFQTFDWQFLWWKHYGAAPYRRLYILIIRAAKEIVGISPFFITENYFFGKKIHSKLQLLGCGVSENAADRVMSQYGPSDYLDIIAVRGCESEVSRLTLEFLVKHKSSFDEIDLSNVPEESVLMKWLIPECRRLGISVKT
jgi:hypothetical protein